MARWGGPQKETDIEMRKYLTRTMVAGLLLGLVVSGIAIAAEKPVKTRVGNLELIFNGGFFPKKLPKKKMAPIGLNLSGKINTVDGTHPPAMRKFVVETDKNGSVFTKGYPTCKAGQLQARNSAAAERICKKALIGKGQTKVDVAFPEQPSIPATSKLLAFNGGTRGGTTTFFIHAYLNQPVVAAIVTTVKIKKIKKGRYGLKSTASIPVIAGGSGSVRSFNLTINKKYKYKGKTRSILNLRCRDGKVLARGEALFSDGTKAKASVLRTCRPKG